MNEPGAVVDVDVQNFQRVVLEGSRELPVLIDFWASWCGPCKTIGPILEKLATEWKGRFVLAKVDVDANPELADAFRIQSIPTVMLVKDGRPLDGFMGALPEKEVRAFLEPHLGAPVGSAVDRAKELAEAGELEEAIEILREHLRKKADDAAARVVLAGHLIAAGRAPEAQKVFDKLSEEERQSTEAKGVQAQLDLLESAGDLAELRRKVEADPSDLGARVALGKALVASGEQEAGLETLLETAIQDVEFEGGAPRKAMVEVFQALGPKHPLTLEYQQRLSVLLCS